MQAVLGSWFNSHLGERQRMCEGLMDKDQEMEMVTDAPDSGHQVDDPPLTPDDQVMAILEYCRSAWADLSRADALFAQGPSHHSGAMGTGLVIEQSFDGEVPNEWHLHQDFLISLGLQRQGDSWLRPVEGFQEVVRLLRDEVGNPVLLEARSEHLRYYLKAHGMYLQISTGTNAGSGAGS